MRVFDPFPPSYFIDRNVPPHCDQKQWSSKIGSVLEGRANSDRIVGGSQLVRILNLLFVVIFSGKTPNK